MKALRARFAARISRLPFEHRRIATGAAWVVIFVLIGKAAGAAKEMAVAWRYGVSEAMDAYYLAHTLVFWLPGTLVSALTVVAVPILVRMRASLEPERARFVNELAGNGVLAGLALGGLSLVIVQYGVPILAEGLSPRARGLTWDFALAFVPLAPLSILVGVYTCRLLAQEQQVGSLLEGLPAAVILVLILALSGGDALAPLVWGTIAGVAAQAFWSWQLAKRCDGIGGLPLLTRASPGWVFLRQAVGVMLLGQLIQSCIAPLDQYAAAQLGEGAVAAFGYTNRIVSLLVGLGSIAISRPLLPVLSASLMHDGHQRARSIALKWSLAMFVTGVLAAALTAVGAEWGVAVLFERGAFSPDNTREVGQLLKMASLQLPFYFGGLVLVQLLAGLGKYRVLALIAFASLALKAMLNPWLAGVFGLGGILLATGLMYAWSAIGFLAVIGYAGKTFR